MSWCGRKKNKNKNKKKNKMPSTSQDAKLVRATRKAIGQLLAKGHPYISDAARMLGTNPRTLQRRLAAAETSYSELVDDVRFQKACRLLENEKLTIAETASALGYSYPAHFTRAFVRWTGMTPRQYRTSDS